jgi:ADP-ribose pyrophosphatase YjhB (NUDIX family)/nicotinic acid mononucleotide adenylyltransferase
MAMIVHTVNSLHSLYSDNSDSPAAYNQGEPSEIFHRVKIIDEVSRTAEALQNLRKETSLTDASFTLVLGSDEWLSLLTKQWVNSDWILMNVNFLIVRRTSFIKELEYAKEFGSISNETFRQMRDNKERMEYVDWIIPKTSSTNARRMMNFDPLCFCDQVSPVVMSYIRRNKLYGQSEPKEYKDIEDELVNNYDPFRFPRPSVTVTSAIFHDDRILLVKRLKAPYHDYWCLPGGFANPKETCEEAGVREVSEETGFTIDKSQVHQVGVFKPKDPRCDVNKDYWGYDIGMMFDFNREGILPSDPDAQDDAKDAMWYPIGKLNEIPLAFHHRELIDKAIKLRQTL